MFPLSLSSRSKRHQLAYQFPLLLLQFLLRGPLIPGRFKVVYLQIGIALLAKFLYDIGSFNLYIWTPWLATITNHSITTSGIEELAKSDAIELTILLINIIEIRFYKAQITFNC